METTITDPAVQAAGRASTLGKPYKDYARTAKACEGAKQAKYRRWATEMSEHGWTCTPPTEQQIEELAYARIEGR